jgi:hypothetical protein
VGALIGVGSSGALLQAEKNSPMDNPKTLAIFILLNIFILINFKKDK